MAKPAAGHTGGSGWERNIKKERREGEKREAIFLISSFVSFRRPTLRPPSALSLSLSLSSPRVPPPTVDNLVRRMTGQSSYSVSFADRRRYYFVL